jgi:putative NIF3 family GTP cyclohydrolase 1 type 2
MNDFFLSGAQAFISGDLKYHDARNAEEMNLGLIDIGHFESERLMLDVLKERLCEKFAKLNFNIIVDAYNLENDPFIFY